jgi:hypothetical protein
MKVARAEAPKFRKLPTFEEIAGSLRQRPPPAPPIHRDALEYWNSFEAGWLKRPFDELTAQASLIKKTATR